MPRRFWFPPSHLHPKVRLIAVCPRCAHNATIFRDTLIARFGDVPLYTLEPKLRCNFRGYDGNRPRCGHPGRFELIPKLRKVTPTALYYWPIGKDDPLEEIG